MLADRDQVAALTADDVLDEFDAWQAVLSAESAEALDEARFQFGVEVRVYVDVRNGLHLDEGVQADG